MKPKLSTFSRTILLRTVLLRKIALICLVAATSWSLAAAVATPDCPATLGDLYARIRSVGLDPKRVYHVRGASIDRPNLHIDLDDGTLAFTEDICGQTTGAVFEGEGDTWG